MTTPSLRYTNGLKDFHRILQEAIQICFHPSEAHSAAGLLQSILFD